MCRPRWLLVFRNTIFSNVCCSICFIKQLLLVVKICLTPIDGSFAAAGTFFGQARLAARSGRLNVEPDAAAAVGRRVRRSDDSERRGTDSGAVSSRRIQAHDVEDVVSVCTDLETKTFPETVQANVARDREIPKLERRPAHQVAAGASIYGYSVDQSRRTLREPGYIEPLCLGASA